VYLDSHTLRRAQAAADLANALVPGLRRGRPFAAPEDGAELLERTNAVIGAHARLEVDLDDARGLQRSAAQFSEVFTALEAGRQDTAAEKLNDMIAEYGARPTLIRHDGEPWHLHYHPADTPRVAGLSGGFAVGLAILVGTGRADRLGTCSADACDRAYVDASRNGTKRFCSTACQNRAKTAAFRARQAAPNGDDKVSDLP
jgi:predicted RNA-binding Zn ribbon-like protein